MSEIGIVDECGISRVAHEEDIGYYNVWKIASASGNYILKKSTPRELAVYRSYLSQVKLAVPRLLGSTEFHDDVYILLEHISDSDLRKCTREALISALDALISIQDKFWESQEMDGVGTSFEESMEARKSRGEYIKYPEIKRAYNDYLTAYTDLPRTLCHDDLLPFNVIYDGSRAVLIDWEHAGILPYPTPITRLIAHCSDDENAFFYMNDADKEFAVEYYFEHFIKGKGISRADYMRSVDLFLLYEYCEWIMLGKKYGETNSARYKEYLRKAADLVSPAP